MTAPRAVIGVAGAMTGGYGLWLLITTVPAAALLAVASWMAVAVVLHDAVWSPAVLAVGRLLTALPPAPRAAAQAGLLVAGCLVVVAVPMIMAQGRQPASTTILVQPIGLNLLLLVGFVTVGSLLAWVLRILADRRRQPTGTDQSARRP